MKGIWIFAVAAVLATVGLAVARAETTDVFTVTDTIDAQLTALSGGCNDDCCCDACCEPCPPAGPVALIPEMFGIAITGWIEAGGTASGDHPRTRFVAPVGFNDRQEVQLNQAYLRIGKALNTDENWFDLGGQVDVLYGTDARFSQATGLESYDTGASRWNRRTFYHLAMPQLYAEFGLGNLSVKAGHWYTTIGFETVTAPDNFFYSHAYTMLYGEPFTHTGVIATYDINDQISTYTAIHNGWDNFDSDRERAGMLSGGSWTSEDGRYSLALAFTSGDEINNWGFFSNRTLYSFVASAQCTDNLTYIVQHDQGWQVDDQGTDLHAEWYGVNQYLLYTLNDSWRFGMRGEWFRDDDGVRVFAPGSGIWGNYFACTLGLNWSPINNVVIRPECRWDWFDGVGKPFDGATKDSQFTAAFDGIIQY